MKSTPKAYTVLLLIFITSLSVLKAQTRTFSYSNNCIKPSEWVSNIDSLQLPYYKFLEFNISAFYMIRDSIMLDINQDNCADYILVLSPITQEYREDTVLCNPHAAKRLLAVFKSNATGHVIGCINEDFIPNNYDYQSDPYLGIEKNEFQGFNMAIFTGSRIKCRFDYVFKGKNKNIYFSNGKLNCYLTDLTASEEKEFNYPVRKKYRIEKFKLLKYLYNTSLKAG